MITSCILPTYPKSQCMRAKTQHMPMHPCANGADTVQGNASESQWIAHSMMQKYMLSVMAVLQTC